MEFFLTLGVLTMIASLLSAAISVPIFRLKKPFAKPLVVGLGVVLFVVFSWAGLVTLIMVSARAGHPF